MFDDLRQQGSDEASFEQEEQKQDAYTFKEEAAKPSPFSDEGKILGMTAPQRFFIAFMLLTIACLLSILGLIVTGRIWI